MKTIMIATAVLTILLSSLSSLAKVDNMNSLIRQGQHEQAVAYRNLERYFGFDHSVKVAQQINADSRVPVADSGLRIRLLSRK